MYETLTSINSIKVCNEKAKISIDYEIFWGLE